MKKSTTIGIALLLLALATLFAGSALTGSASSALQSQIVTKNLTIPSNGFTYLEMQVNGSTYILTLLESSAPLNVYLFNTTAFNAWSANEPGNSISSGLAGAVSFEGKGAFIIYSNTSAASIPAESGVGNSSLVYNRNETLPYPAGVYYVVMDNTHGSKSTSEQVTTRAVYLPPADTVPSTNSALSGVSQSFQTEVDVGILFFILLIAGIIILVYGFFRGREPIKMFMPKSYNTPEAKEQRAKAEQQYVNELYKESGVKPKGHHAPARRAKPRRGAGKRHKKRA